MGDKNTYSYLPQTENDIEEMLTEIGVESIESLFDDIPATIRQNQAYKIPPGTAEMELSRKMSELAGKNRRFDTVFAGAGSYDHFIPSVVSHLAYRSEFYTAYTPYQPEISQGILQGIFEFQTMVCQLTGLDAANASLYDGATAVIEACAMALNSCRKSNRIIISGSVNPNTINVVTTYFADLDAELLIIPPVDGAIDSAGIENELSKGAAGLLVQSPNIFGILEDYSGLADAVHDQNGYFIMSVNPMSLSLAKSPAEWGADIAVGDTQSLGLAMNFGGPTAGFISSTAKLLRKLPGRIVGQSVDTNGKRAFVLTLQAREQHIKRQRATSNICSNQALAALASTIYMASIGKEGFTQIGNICYQNSHYLLESILKIDGISQYGNGHFFNEFTVMLPEAAADIVDKFTAHGILAGVPYSSLDPDADPRLLIIASTEKHKKEDIDRFSSLLREVLS